MSIYQELSKVLDCLCGLIEQEGLPVCSCALHLGELPTLDYCGSCGDDRCGAAFVTLTGAVPSRGLDSAYTGCSDGFTVQANAGILRCAPYSTASGPPTDEENNTLVSMVAQDMWLVRKALVCCYDGDLALGTWSAVPDQGGCAGGAWAFGIPFGI